MLNTVIQNIALKGDYYQKVDLEFSVRKDEPLYKYIESHSN